MAKISQIKFELTGIGKFIADHVLNVPRYQRSFAWEEKNVVELLTDMEEAMSNGHEYFVGSIVVSRKESAGTNVMEIVDGQQRLATVTILIAALRNWYKKNGEDGQVNFLDREYLQIFNPRSGESETRFTLGTNDASFFEKIVIQHDFSVTPTKDSHQRILDAVNYTSKYVQRIAAAKAKAAMLHDLREYVDSKLQVITVVVPDYANAFTIFETLNDRGIELAQTDLLKNYLFMKAGDRRLDEVQTSWSKMTGIIEAAESEKTILLYIKHYWSSLNGLTREAQLYTEIKKQITTATTAVTLTKGLEESAELYAAILNVDHPRWNDYDENAKEYLRTLNYLKLTQFRPLLLSILSKFTRKEVTLALKVITSWSVRNLITGSIGGGQLESEFSVKAKDVSSNSIKNAKALYLSLKKVIPNDKEFKDKFVTATVSQSYLARYYLRAIENQLRGGKDPGLLVNSNPQVVTLEHILPENPSDLNNDWPSFTKEVKDAAYKRIGNLTLLKAKLNSTIGNGPFAEKKVAYGIEEFKITNDLTSLSTWTYNDIEERQKKLAEIAVKTWDFQLG